MNSEMSPRNNQNNVIFPGETLEQGSPYQDMPFSLVESPLEFSIDPNPISDHDTPQGQSADFQNMSDGQYQNPYHTMSVNAEGTIDFNAQVNSGSPMYQPTRQQSSPDSNWTGLPIAYPQGAHDHGPIESQESEQDELVTQISSDFDPSLSPTSPVYTNLMKQNHFSHPNPASTLEDPLLQKAPVVSSQLPLQEHYQFQDVHTPSSSTRDCRRTVPELHQMPRQLDPGRRTLSDYMITLDKDNHVKVEGKICRTKKEGINQFSETHLQVPPPGSSPGLTYGSPGSSLEYLEDPAKPSLKRKRKLTPSGRARAAKVRKVGACSECRIRKVKCDHVVPEDPGQADVIPARRNSHRTMTSDSSEHHQNTPLPLQVSPIEGQPQVFLTTEQSNSFFYDSRDGSFLNLAVGDQTSLYTGQNSFPMTIPDADLYPPEDVTPNLSRSYSC